MNYSDLYSDFAQNEEYLNKAKREAGVDNIIRYTGYQLATTARDTDIYICMYI